MGVHTTFTNIFFFTHKGYTFLSFKKVQFLAKVLFREIDFTEKTEPTTKLRPETEVPPQVPGRTSSKTIALFFYF